MDRTVTRILYTASLPTASLLLGCGGSEKKDQTPVFPVSGSVKMFGAPLADATVAFAPEGNQPTAVGTTDSEGNFQLTTYDFGDGAAEGSYHVVVSKSAAAPAAEVAEGEGHDADDADDGHDASGGGKSDTELVPAQYSSTEETPLSAEVKSSGENVFKFEIK